jgi:hypothetical protein
LSDRQSAWDDFGLETVAKTRLVLVWISHTCWFVQAKIGKMKCFMWLCDRIYQGWDRIVVNSHGKAMRIVEPTVTDSVRISELRSETLVSLWRLGKKGSLHYFEMK